MNNLHLYLNQVNFQYFNFFFKKKIEGIVLLINERGTGAYPLNKVHSLRMPFHAPPELRSSTVYFSK